MDNITHSFAGALLGEMGLKRRSRFAMAACLLGANAPDIDVFAPLVLPVDGIEFHRGPLHSVFAWPVLAAGDRRNPVAGRSAEAAWPRHLAFPSRRHCSSSPLSLS